jgi:hypothetical protein
MFVAYIVTAFQMLIVIELQDYALNNFDPCEDICADLPNGVQCENCDADFNSLSTVSSKIITIVILNFIIANDVY